MIPIIYDSVNSGAVDEAFFIALLKQLDVKKIADIGCGTGRITLQLAAQHYDITAIDPHEEAIAYAKTKRFAERVQWHVATSEVLQENTYDAVIMTANVAQVFITDESFKAVMNDAYRALKKGGHLLFDTRNIEAKVWEAWMADTSPDFATHAQTGEKLIITTTYEPFVNDVLTFCDTVTSAATNEVLAQERIALKFRTVEAMQHMLREVGFHINDIYGDWQMEEATSDSASLIFDCVKG